MNLYKIKRKIFFIFKLFTIFAAAFLLSGYGYTGDLPELGKTTKPPEKNEVPIKQIIPAKNNSEFEFPSTKTFFPRIYSNYKMDRYSEYLQDIKQVEPVLVSLKQVIKSDNPDRIQQFSAKINVLNLYVNNLKDKYGNKTEKNYESFKQLILLNKYLTESTNYQKIDKILNPLDAVLEIIQNAN